MRNYMQIILRPWKDIIDDHKRKKNRKIYLEPLCGWNTIHS